MSASKKSNNKRKKGLTIKWWLTLIHRWLGFPLAVLFFVTIVSGVLVGFEDLLETFDDFGQQYKPVTLEENAVALTKLSDLNISYRQIILPTVATPYYQLRSRAERLTFRIGDLKEIDRYVNDTDDFFSFMLRLHRNYLLGREGLFGISGVDYVAWVGLLSLVISIIALWLWWPLRKTFKWRDVVPNGGKRKNFYYSHMTAGIIVLLAILLLALTGAGLTYRTLTRDILKAESPNYTGVRTQPLYTAANWQSWLSIAQAKIPGGQLQRIQTVRIRSSDMDAGSAFVDLRGALEFRFVTDGDWLGMAGSKVIINTDTSALLGVQRFDDLDLGDQLYAMIRPLHTGSNLSTPYLILLLVFMVISAVMVLSGFVSFIQKKRKYRRMGQTILNAVTDQPGSATQFESASFLQKNLLEFRMKQTIISVVVSVIFSVVVVSFITDDNNEEQSPKASSSAEPGGGDSQNRHVNSANSRGEREAPMGSHANRGNVAMQSSHEIIKTQRVRESRSHSHSSHVAGFRPNDLENSLREMTAKLALDETQQMAIREFFSAYREKNKTARQTIGSSRQAIAQLSPSTENYETKKMKLLKKSEQAFSESLLLRVEARERVYGLLNQTQQHILASLELADNAD